MLDFQSQAYYLFVYDMDTDILESLDLDTARICLQEHRDTLRKSMVPHRHMVAEAIDRILERNETLENVLTKSHATLSKLGKHL